MISKRFQNEQHQRLGFGGASQRANVLSKCDIPKDNERPLTNLVNVAKVILKNQISTKKEP